MITRTHSVVFAITLVWYGQLTVGQTVERDCLEEIIGCGVTLGSGTDNLECNCVSNLADSLPFDFFIFCAIQEIQPDCCPCQFQTFMHDSSSSSSSSSGSSSSSSSSSTELQCADQEELRKLKRLVTKARKIGQRISKSCPNGINDSCCPSKLVRTIEKTNNQIRKLTASIKADCEEMPIL